MTKKVKRQIMGIGLGAGALCAIVLLVYFGNQGGKAKPFRFLDVSRKEVYGIAVENEAGSFALAADETGVFRLQGREALPLDQKLVGETLDGLLALSGKKIAGLQAEACGFDGAQTRVTLKGKTGDAVLEIGKRTQSGVYALQGGVLYRGDGDLEKLKTLRGDAFLDRRLTPELTEEELREISLVAFSGSDRAEDLVIERSANKEDAAAPDSYFVTHPTRYAVSPEILMKTVLQPMNGLRAAEVVDTDVSPAALARYGLENPTHSLHCELGDNRLDLLFGDITQDAQFYVLRQGVNILYKVPVSSVLFLQVRLPDIVSRVVINRPIDSFDRLEIVTPGKTYQFDATGTGDGLSVKSGGTEIDAEGFRKFYATMLAIMIEGEAKEPEGTAPAVTVRIGYRGSDKTDVVDYIPLDGGSRRFFVRVNGSGLFYVMSKDVTTMAEAAEKLVAGETVAIS